MGEIRKSDATRGFSVLREAMNYVRGLESTKLKAYYSESALTDSPTYTCTDFLRKAKASAIINSTCDGRKEEVVKIIVTKRYLRSTISRLYYTADGVVLSEQELTKSATSNIFAFKFTAYFSDYALLKI